jgi:hypothetical protein
MNSQVLELDDNVQITFLPGAIDLERRKESRRRRDAAIPKIDVFRYNNW